MATSLYDIGIKTYLQILPAVGGFLEKGRAYFEENKIGLDEVINIRFYDDMLPLRFQLFSVVHHSLGAIEGLEKGEFSTPSIPSDIDYLTLKDLINEADEKLKCYGEEQINAFVGDEVIFKLGPNSIPFVAEDFILTFSLPNFYFHATTAYDILRSKGVPLGKKDFLGQMRMKQT